MNNLKNSGLNGIRTHGLCVTGDRGHVEVMGLNPVQAWIFSGCSQVDILTA